MYIYTIYIYIYRERERETRKADFSVPAAEGGEEEI